MVAISGYISGVTIRSAAIPVIAITQLSVLLAPLVATAALYGAEYWAVAIGLMLHLVGSVRLVISLHSRTTAQLMAEHRLAQIASTDPLTGLANRTAFDTALTGRLSIGFPVVAMIDLDRFKPINDAHGHAAGDELLKSVAERMRDALGGTHVVARLGGDEFAVLFDAIDVAAATRFAKAIVFSLEQPFTLTAATVEIGASVGLAVAVDGDTVNSLCQRADDRLYDAKRAGRGQVASALASAA